MAYWVYVNHNIQLKLHLFVEKRIVHMCLGTVVCASVQSHRNLCNFSTPIYWNSNYNLFKRSLPMWWYVPSGNMETIHWSQWQGASMFDRMRLRALHMRLELCFNDIGPFSVQQGCKVAIVKQTMSFPRGCLRMNFVWATNVCRNRLVCRDGRGAENC